MRRIHALLLTLGLLCLAWMLHTVGLASVWRTLASLGWGLLPLVLIEGVGEVVHTAGWRRCLGGLARSRSLARLFWMRMAGYAINYFTPSAALAGEITRVSLVAPAGGTAEATSAVLIDKACMALAHLLLVVLGAVFLLWRRVKLPPVLQSVMLLSGSLLAAGILAFMLMQKHGRLGAVLRWLTARGLGGSWGRKLAENTSAVDEAFRIFYRERKCDLALALAWHVAGFATGFLQTWWFFALVGQHPPMSVIAGIWVIGLWFDLLVFVVPMSLGTLEGSRIVTFSAVGYRAVEGMTYGMVLRLGQWLWAVMGIIGYAWLAFRRPRPIAPSLSGQESPQRSR